MFNETDLKCIGYIQFYYARVQKTTNFINMKKNTGEYQIKFDAGNLSSGIYFYSLYADDIRIDKKKLILLK